MKTHQPVSLMDKDLRVSIAAQSAHRSSIWKVSPDLLGTVNSNGYFETANPAWMTVLGWTEAEVTSVSLLELVHPDDVERTRSQSILTYQGQPAIKFANRYRCKDGTYRWISWVGVPEDGMIFCSGRDITAEIEQAEHLELARRERNTAWAVSQDLLVTVALDGTFTSANTAWLRLLGWTENELLGRTFSELTHPDDLENTLAVFESISQAPLSTPYEFRLRHKDGSFRWFAWTAALAGESVYGNGRETTAERENAAIGRAAEDAMRNSLAFLAGTSGVARAMREADWSASTLGHPRQWPQSLRSVVNLLIGSAFPMFVCWGPKLATLYNDAYAEILGEKHPGALGKPILETWSEIRAEIEPLVARALAGESTFLENLPLRMRRHGFDEDTWFTFSYSPVRDEDGQTAGMYCACIETTQSVLAQRQLRDRQDWLQSLFHQAPGFAAVLRGPDHRFEMVNQAYLDITGNRPLMGSTVAQAFPEVIGQGYVALLDGVYATGEPYVARAAPVTVNQGEGKAPYEALLDLMYQPLRDAQGRVEGIFVLGHDVTEQHRAQQALLAFSDSIPAMAWMATPDGLLERFNAQWYDYTGTSHEQAKGRDWVNSVHPDDLNAARAVWVRARDGNEAWQIEYRLRRKDGVYRWFLARAVPQLNPSGAVARWFGTTTDIDDARQAAQSLQDADRQKDEFLATLAHELRNPLAPIRTAFHLLSAPKANEQVRSHATEIIGRQVGHMSRLLDDLLDVARITQRKLVLKKERVQIETVVGVAMEAARSLADAKRHQMVAVLEDPSALVLADPVRFAQVLTNLLNNAVKYTDPGGSIRLETRREGDELCLTVTDNGIGLTPVALNKVFIMFAQEQAAIERAEGGLGIGLALAKGLVQLHGGSLSAHSQGEGKGSCFMVKLPFDAGLELPAPVVGPSALPSRARKVLLADDNRDSVAALAEYLRMNGHLVHTAHDGAQAADLAMRLQPDVLILDIGMPGMTGYDVAKHIRSQSWGARPLLIAATGWGQDEDRQKALRAGFDFHLTKPFDPVQLAELIANRGS